MPWRYRRPPSLPGTIARASIVVIFLFGYITYLLAHAH